MANIAKINLEIKECSKCPFARVYRDDDRFYCSSTDISQYLFKAGERVPDDCPFVLGRLEDAIDKLERGPYKSLLNASLREIESKQKVDNPYHKFDADHALRHAEKVLSLGKKFLEDAANWGLLDRRSIPKQRLLFEIAAMFHDVGLADSAKNHASHSAELLRHHIESKKIDIAIEDASDICHAISDHSDGFDTKTWIDAALILGDKLDCTGDRIIRIRDDLAKQMKTIETVSFGFFGKDGKVKGAELKYTTSSEFDVKVFVELYPKWVLFPYNVTKKFLKLSEFRFVVNDEVIDHRKLLGVKN